MKKSLFGLMGLWCVLFGSVATTQEAHAVRVWVHNSGSGGMWHWNGRWNWIGAINRWELGPEAADYHTSYVNAERLGMKMVAFDAVALNDWGNFSYWNTATADWHWYTRGVNSYQWGGTYNTWRYDRHARNECYIGPGTRSAPGTPLYWWTPQQGHCHVP